jgi:hypothetical protein
MRFASIMIAFAVLFMYCSFAAAAGENGTMPDKPKERYDGIYSQERFDEADSDDDGLLTWEEAVAGGYPFEGKTGKKRFTRADTDGDGKLTLQEARMYKKWEKEKGRKKMGKGEGATSEGTMHKEGKLIRGKQKGKEEGWRKEKYRKELYTKERFQESDTNGDGYLDFNEAVASQYMFEGEEGHRRFKHADADGDEKLSLKELKAQKDWEIKHRKELRERHEGGGEGAMDTPSDK